MLQSSEYSQLYKFQNFANVTNLRILRTLQSSEFCPHSVLKGFVPFSQQIMIIYLYSIKRMTFIIQTVFSVR
jgi:hypothetical protein